MPSSLPSAGELIRASWQGYIKNWSELFRISIRFVFIGIAEFLLSIAGSFAPGANDMIQVLLALVSLLIVIALFHTIIRMMRTMIRINDGKKTEMNPEAERDALRTIFPLFWVGILQGLIILGTSLPLIFWRLGYLFSGVWSPLTTLVTMVLAAPIVYIILLLSFSSLTVIDTDARGMNAIAASRDLVFSRWGQVFWREICGMALFLCGVWIITSGLILILTLALGPDRLLAVATLQTADPIANGATNLISAITQSIVLPLILLFQIKLYRALKK